MALMSHRDTRDWIALRSRGLRAIPFAAFALDAVFIVASVLLAAVGRERLTIFDVPAEVNANIAVVSLVVTVLWLGLSWALGAYSGSLFDAGTDEFRRVVRAGLLTAGSVGVAAYMAKIPLSRGFFLLCFAIGIPAVLAGRFMLRSTLRRARTRGALSHSVLICGSPGRADDLACVLRRERRIGYRVTGILTPSGNEVETPSGIPVLGKASDVTTMVHTTGANVLLFTDGGVSSAQEMRRIAWDLEKDDVQVVVAPSVSEVSGERVRVRPVGGLPLIHIDPPRVTDAARWGKRLFDAVSAAGLLLALSPLIVVTALRIKLYDGGPVLFRQTRTGRDGREFSCLKFRTMVVDAEARLAQLHEETGHEGGLFKMADDPRITKPGKFLRRYSIDELPQLVNVLRGDMSLVGPRPPLPTEVADYDQDTARRLRVRPGLTGLWQVSGRSDLSFEEAVRLDLYYVDNWSVLQDASILLKTFRAVVGSSGAY